MKKTGLHYAWIILVSCFFVYGGSMGLGLNCSGLFNAAISDDLNMSISKFTFSTVFNGLSAAAALMAVDEIFRKFNIKAVLSISALFYASYLFLRSFCNNLLEFCLVNVIGGVSSAFLFYVPVPMLINAWFREKNGMALSIATLSSGVMGAVMNSVLSGVIERSGWRTASMVNGAVSALLVIPAVLLFVVKTPREKGLKPYGYKEEPERKPITSPGDVDIREHVNIDFSLKEKRNRLFLSIILAFIAYLVSTCTQSMAHYARVNGLSLTVGASLATAGMIGNMIGKAATGALIDKKGALRAFDCSFAGAAAGFLILAFFPGAPVFVLYAGIGIAALSAANNVIAMPVVVGSFSSGEEYVTFMSRVSVSTMISTALGTYISGALYDLTGSYLFEYVLYALLTLLGLMIIHKVMKKPVD